MFTEKKLAADVSSLGVQEGMVVLMHTSYKAIGAVKGGPTAVLRALLSAVGEKGTLVLPTMSLNLCDPSEEENAHPEDQWEHVRGTTPLYDPATSPTIFMGIIPETFRQMQT